MRWSSSGGSGLAINLPYTVDDGNEGSSTGIVTVIVSPVNN
jgi:hypothetical protein